MPQINNFPEVQDISQWLWDRQNFVCFIFGIFESIWFKVFKNKYPEFVNVFGWAEKCWWRCPGAKYLKFVFGIYM